MTLTDLRGGSRPADVRWERWGAASGFAVLVVSAGAVAFERGAPSPGASSAEITEFLADHRGTLVTQSLLFVVGAGILLWFLGSLRSYLLRAEGGTGRLSAVAYGAGVAGTAVGVVAQAFQVGAATGSIDDVPVALFATMGAVFAVANLPLAVMLAGVAVLSFRAGAFPSWLGWLSAAAAAASAALALAMATGSGPMAPGGWLNTALYSAFVILPTTRVMVRRLG
jgi:hypothetical protein